MAKIKISSVDLAWIFTEQLRARFLPNRIAPVAIIPTKNGWAARDEPGNARSTASASQKTSHNCRSG